MRACCVIARLALTVALVLPAVGWTRAPALPADIRAFVARRDLCDHFRGEEGYDAARTAEIAAQLKRNCRGTDAALARLKRVYRGNARVQTVLTRYESRIE